MTTKNSAKEMYTNWKLHEKYVRKHVGKMSTEEMAKELGVTEYDLKLYIHRERIFPVQHKFRNLAYEVIKIKFVHPEYFRPTTRFYNAVGITQRKWWSAYRGERRLTESQYKALCAHLGVTLQEAFDARQTSWLDSSFFEQD